MVGYVSDPSIGGHEQTYKLKSADPPLSPICGDLSSLSDTFLDFDAIKEWIDEFPNPEKCEMAFEKLVQVGKKDVSDIDGSGNGSSKYGHGYNTNTHEIIHPEITNNDEFKSSSVVALIKMEESGVSENEGCTHDSVVKLERYPTNGWASEVSEKLIQACPSCRIPELSYSATSSSSNDSDEEDEDDYSFDKSRMKGSKKVAEIEEEIEEGEIRESDTGGMVEWGEIDEDDDADLTICTGPVRSKNEIKVLPLVPPVTVTLQAHHHLLPVGVVLSIIDGEQVIVEGAENHGPLNEGSVLWITETRAPLGYVDEIFGPVKNPYYVVRYNTKDEIPRGIGEGTLVSYAAEFAEHILNDDNLYRKGYDASGENDEELSDEVEFSDDEKEAEYRRSMKMSKRNTCEKRHERKCGRSKKGHLQGSKGELSCGKKDPCPSSSTSSGNVIMPQSSVVRPLPNLTQGAGLTELPCGIWTSNISFKRPISFQSGPRNGGFSNQMPPPGQMQVGQRPMYSQLGQTMMMQNQMGQTLPAGVPGQQLVLPAQQQFGQMSQSAMPQPSRTLQTGMPAQHQMGQTFPAGIPAHFQMGQSFPAGMPTHLQMGQSFPADMPAYQVQKIWHSGMPAQQLHGQMLPGGMSGQQQFGQTLTACVPAQQQLGLVLPAGMQAQQQLRQAPPAGMPAQQKSGNTLPAGMQTQQQPGQTLPADVQTQQQPGQTLPPGMLSQCQPGQTLSAGMPSQQLTQPAGMPGQQQLGQKPPPGMPTHQAGQRPSASMPSQQLISPTQQQLRQTLPAGMPSQQQASTSGMLTQQQLGQTLPHGMPSQQQQTAVNANPQQLGQPLQAVVPAQQQQMVMPCQHQLWQAMPAGMPMQQHLGQALPAIMPTQPHLGQSFPAGITTQQQFWQALPSGIPAQQPWQTLPGGMTHQQPGQVFMPNGVPSHQFGQPNFLHATKLMGLSSQETQTTPVYGEQVATQNGQCFDQGATDGRGASGGSKPFRRARPRNFHRGRGGHNGG